eukprot:12886594-Prorocentrum_lima.AAC.1
MALHAHTPLMVCTGCATADIKYIWAESAALCQECFVRDYHERGDQFAATQPRPERPVSSACPLCGQGEAGTGLLPRHGRSLGRYPHGLPHTLASRLAAPL